MSDLSPSGTGKSGSSKKPVSAARNAVGLVALVAVLIVGWFEYSAKAGYNSAVTKLNSRIEDENQGLMSATEAETLLGKPADDAGSSFEENHQAFTKKTYTWRGLLKSYTVTAFYTQGSVGGLQVHFSRPLIRSMSQRKSHRGTPSCQQPRPRRLRAAKRDAE